MKDALEVDRESLRADATRFSIYRTRGHCALRLRIYRLDSARWSRSSSRAPRTRATADKGAWSLKCTAVDIFSAWNGNADEYEFDITCYKVWFAIVYAAAST